IINLKGINIKSNNIDNFVVLPHLRAKKPIICALIDKELTTKARGVFDEVIEKSNFAKLSKKEIKKLSTKCDYFLAQGNIMPDIATTFGKILGPKGKMPNPKLGSIVPPNIETLKPVYDRLQKTVRLATKNEPIIKCAIGDEDMKDEEIADNLIAIHHSIIPLLPDGAANIKSTLLKLTMGSTVKI
ncbi:MAG: hypothetical protein V1824_01630, partial [archaeon]